MKLLFWIAVALVAAVLALFAISNREGVSLALWPLSFVLDLPLYIAILAAFLIGFVAGALAAWVAALELELAATRAQRPGASENAPARLAARG